MEKFTIRLKAWLSALAVVFCLAALASPFAQAEEMTVQTLIDRASLEDLIKRYYLNFGNSPESFANFYADDGELILIGQSFKGKAAIAKAYQRPAGEGPQNFSFNSLVSNLIVTVHGNTATAQLVWTENLIKKERDPVQLIAQGREYSTFVKQNGQWKYKTRNVMGGTKPPEGWEE
jgi:ketosteroid isomerase-like protein